MGPNLLLMNTFCWWTQPNRTISGPVTQWQQFSNHFFTLVKLRPARVAVGSIAAGAGGNGHGGGSSGRMDIIPGSPETAGFRAGFLTQRGTWW